ncbi:MAG: Swt1 family HEPN domain-containing protein [Candidatus Latescibacterota bacterium]
MALTNHERIGKALELLRDGLGPFIERELTHTYREEAGREAARLAGEDRTNASRPLAQWDAAPLLKLMREAWNEVFRNTLGAAERNLVFELQAVRNQWAHQQPFSGDDADRGLDSTERLLTAVSAPQAEEVRRLKMELRRTLFEEQARTERRRSAGTAVESQVTGALTPWREVVAPHRDVASGQYQQAEFAADLWQVHLGEGSDEYRDPAEFFRRTFLTESLQRLLVGAVQRLSGKGGDPVVQLQTNFGGGKTHSMLALYHLFSGVKPGELPGADGVLAEAGVKALPAVRRVVLVGNRISPGNPVVKADGTVVRTLWGELAWQLGHAVGGVKEAHKAFARLAADDERATSPGDVLRELMNHYGPCLILIDEWVAYARQLHDQSDLPAGSFETHFTFAQLLTESAKDARGCLLVVSLPASDTSGSPHAVADDVEVGGERGRTALARLRNAVGRVEASWRPASAEEGFEIVRRRLFEPLTRREQAVARDNVARAFYDFYRTQPQEFPPECRGAEYQKRLQAAYPIHPEVFDRLYTDWSTLVKFQRTRGVLRLMAAVIHSLWEKGDRNPLIQPGNLPIDDPRVQSELTRYLSDNWTPVIEKDVDGPSALPLRIDGEVTNLGKFAACRRVARTVYLGSAPTATAANRGIEERQVKLGCLLPGETPSIFADALRRLATSATYLYQDGPRYWYATQPTVTKLAEDRAEQLSRDPDAVAQELGRRLRADLRQAGDFARVHPLPQSGQEVPDDLDARLVVLGIDHPYSKEAGNAAVAAARAILESRGNAPRIYRNTLLFLAVDQSRLQDLDEAARRFLAWQSIVSEKETLDLSPHQVKQAETQLTGADTTVTARLPEAYQWLLVPAQKSAKDPVVLDAVRLTGKEPLAVRASRRLLHEERLLARWAGTMLRKAMDTIPLWRGNHVPVRQLVEDFAKYPYLQRLRGPEVLVEAVGDGVGLMTWNPETFAYADAFDEDTGTYQGLRCGQHVSLPADSPSGLLVKPEVARQAQIPVLTAVRVVPDRLHLKPGEVHRLQAEGLDQHGQPLPLRDVRWAAEGGSVDADGCFTAGQDEGSFAVEAVAEGFRAQATVSISADPVPPPPPPPPPPSRRARRYHGTVKLDAARVGRDASQIAEEVVAHLQGLPGARVTVTLEIAAEIPEGAPDNVVRVVTENGRTLEFDSQGFEVE